MHLPIGGRQLACERSGRRAPASELPTEAEPNHRQRGEPPVREQTERHSVGRPFPDQAERRLEIRAGGFLVLSLPDEPGP